MTDAHMFAETWLDVESYQGDVALDIGANHGDWCTRLARRFNRVVAFEPNPAAAADLLARVNTWDKLDNIAVIPCALGCSEGTWEMFVYDDDRLTCWHATRDDAGPPRSKFWAVTKTLDSFAKHSLFQGSQVDFVKIDVEGFEEQVLLGGAGFLRKFRPRTLLVEIHNQKCAERCSSLLGQTLGYSLETIRHPGYAPGSGAFHAHFWIKGTRSDDKAVS